MAREVLIYGIKMNYDIMAELNHMNDIAASPEILEKSKTWIYTIMKMTVFVLVRSTRNRSPNHASFKC
jgi:hypothetical protein